MQRVLRLSSYWLASRSSEFWRPSLFHSFPPIAEEASRPRASPASTTQPWLKRPISSAATRIRPARTAAPLNSRDSTRRAACPSVPLVEAQRSSSPPSTTTVIRPTSGPIAARAAPSPTPHKDARNRLVYLQPWILKEGGSLYFPLLFV